MKKWFRLSQAAKIAGVSTKTIERTAKMGLIHFQRDKGVKGWRYIQKSELYTAPLITLGRAAKRIGIHYETLRRWIKQGKVKVYSEGRKLRKISLQEISRARKWKGKRLTI